jgi:pseudaminic acid cytidylyltransferase
VTTSDVVAVIPARGGSKRIPGKNIKPFNGVPMIGHSIEVAQRCGLFGRILISTDSEEIAEVAARFGAECAFRRPHDLSDDRTPTAPVVHHALQWLAEQGTPAQYACCIYATAPFIQTGDLQAGYRSIVERDCGSVLSVTSFAFPIFRALELTEAGSLAMFWPEYQLTRSQDLPHAYHDAGQFYWLKVARFMLEPRLYYDDSRPVILPRWRVQDIDTQEDWDRAELMQKVLSEQEGRR